MTGASGFVGRSVCLGLKKAGYSVRAYVRNGVAKKYDVPGVDYYEVGEIDGRTSWTSFIGGVDCIIHCAARLQHSGDRPHDAMEAFRLVNVEGTRRLAEESARSGVRKLIYLSTIKVNGEQTPFGDSFVASDIAAPETAYALSKWEGEQALWAAARRTNLQIVIVRAPLIYGRGVKGNMASLNRLIRLGIPLPVGAVQNKRSLIAIENLIDFLINCITHQAAANRTFLVSDGEDISTRELVETIGRVMGRPARIWSVSVRLLYVVGVILGKRDMVGRLLGSLQVDGKDVRRDLGWTPPLGVEEAVRRMVQKG